MKDTFELIDTYSESAVIKVIGIGGGGNNAVSHMAGNHIEGVEFICANNFNTLISLFKVNVNATFSGSVMPIEAAKSIS